MKPGLILLLLLLLLFLLLVGPFVTAFLYNHTVPSITGWREIGWWDAFKLILLWSLLTVPSRSSSKKS